MEIWKPVVNFEGIYEVSNFGNIKTVKTGHLKKPSLNKKDNRLHIALWKNNIQTMTKPHRLVLLAFVGPPPAGHECCHNDGNPSNNNLTNLRWDTASNNQRDRVKHGTSNRGERCGAAKLTEEQALKIISDPRPQSQIAKDYGVLQNTISRIKTGRRWAHLQGKEYNQCPYELSGIEL
jgi:hypothetical protein